MQGVRGRVGGTGYFVNLGATIHAAFGIKRYLLAPLFGAVAGAADWLIRWLTEIGVGQWINIPSWAIGVFVTLLVSMIWILEYATKLRKERDPNVSVIFDPSNSDFQEVNNPKGQRALRTFRFRVINTSTEVVERCSAKVVSVAINRGKLGDLSGLLLKQKNDELADTINESHKEESDIRPFDHVDFDMCRLNELSDNTSMRILFATQGHRHLHLCKDIGRDMFPVKLEIKIVAKNLRADVLAYFSLSIDKDGVLHCEKIEKPQSGGSAATKPARPLRRGASVRRRPRPLRPPPGRDG